MQNIIPVIAAVAVNGARNAEKNPLKMHSGSRHIRSGYPQAAVTAMIRSSALLNIGVRLTMPLPHGLSFPAVSEMKPIGHILQQNTRPLKNDRIRSGMPNKRVQPVQALAAPAPKRLRIGLSLVSHEFASGNLSEANPRASEADNANINIRQTFLRSHFIGCFLKPQRARRLSSSGRRNRYPFRQQS
jgi:hypothetical protein